MEPVVNYAQLDTNIWVFLTRLFYYVTVSVSYKCSTQVAVKSVIFIGQ